MGLETSAIIGIISAAIGAAGVGTSTGMGLDAAAQAKKQKQIEAAKQNQMLAQKEAENRRLGMEKLAGQQQKQRESQQLASTQAGKSSVTQGNQLGQLGQQMQQSARPILG